MASADDLKTEILSQGEKVRDLKAQKAGDEALKPELEKLLSLKKAYKEKTGTDYVAPGQTNKSKGKKEGKGAKQENEAANQPPAIPIPSGNPPCGVEEEKGEKLSKKDLKKLERKEKKESKKQLSGADERQDRAESKVHKASPTTEGIAKSVPLAAPSMQPDRLCLQVEPDSLSSLKCLVVAEALGFELQVTTTRPPEALSFQETPLLFNGKGFLISGVAVIVRYLASLKGVWNDADFLADQWVEWDARLLGPSAEQVARLAAAGKTTLTESVSLYPLLNYEENSFFYRAAVAVQTTPCSDEVQVSVAELESHLQFLETHSIAQGSAQSVVEALVLTSAQFALSFLPEALNRYPKVASQCAGLCGLPAFNSGKSAFDNLPRAERAAPEVIDMNSGIQSILISLFTQAILSAYPVASEMEDFRVAQVVRCAFNPKVKYGDFQCNTPMGLFKALKDTSTPASRPHEVAAKIIECLPSNNLIEEVAVAGPGFINIFLRSSFITDRLNSLLNDGPTPPKVKKLKVAVDFSSPNIAKDMHVGHLRSTIIGDTLCRTLEFVGHEVLRVNHVGDWGTQFGMLIQYIREKFPDFLSNPPNIQDLTSFYKGARAMFEEDADFKKKSQLNVVELQSGNQECLQIWQLLCDISRNEFKQVYDRLQVKLEEVGESFYNPKIPGVIKQLELAGLIQEDDGAKIVFLPTFKFPLIVQKRDGGFGYDSTDMAAVHYRIKELGCDWIVYVTDMGQSEHFQLIFETAKAMGWCEHGVRLDHVGFGLVQGDDGKKFKTRSGETVRLVDLLDAAVHRMEASLNERVQEGKSPLLPEEIAHASAAIGYGAVKYFDQSQHPTTDYAFSYDRMLDTRGNTAVYLLFAHARLASIIRKASEEFGVDVQKLKASGVTVQIQHPSERNLAFELLQLGEVIERVLADLTPNRICDYLYALSTTFKEFVTNCKVLGTPEQDSRLLLCEATGTVMRTCFELLGITPLFKI